MTELSEKQRKELEEKFDKEDMGITEKKKTGCPPKYTKWLEEENKEKIREWFGMGLTQRQICKNMGITQTTWCEWKNRFTEFSKLAEEGVQVQTEHVVNSLYENTQGHEYEETETVYGKDGEIISQKVRKKKVLPSNDAIKEWLHNMDPDKWKQRQEHKVSGGVNLTMEEKIEAVRKAAEKAVKGGK